MPQASVKCAIFQYKLVRRGNVEFTPSSLSVNIPILRNNEILNTPTPLIFLKKKNLCYKVTGRTQKTQQFPALRKLTSTTISSMNTPTKINFLFPVQG